MSTFFREKMAKKQQSSSIGHYEKKKIELLMITHANMKKYYTELLQLGPDLNR